MVFVNEKMGNDWQTIDKDNGMRMTYHGSGGPENPYEFNLYYYDSVIPFFARRRTDRAKDGSHIVIWDVERVNIPAELQGAAEKIKVCISEALDACGILFSRKNVDSVSVKFLNHSTL
jgi:hypothetical protein